MENDMRKLIDQVKNFGKSPINEIFGLSQKEKDIKQLRADIEQAKKEVDDIDLSALFRQTDTNTNNERYIMLVDIIIGNLKKRMPTFLKLFPEILGGIRNNGTNAASSRYDYNGKVLDGITLSTLSYFLTPKYTDNINDLSKENMKRQLDNLIRN
jgi:hypothetical protein